MPKRPRTDDAIGYCPLQLKTHVGQKEVNMGVNKDKNMKAVYDHTLNLMLQGQKAYYTGLLASNGHSCADDGHPHDDAGQQVMPGQLQLNMSGQLINNNNLGAQSLTCESPAQAEPTCRLCLAGHKTTALTTCPYCEQLMCQTCSRQCDYCIRVFCQFCSVLNYDERDEHIICLNCLS
ncbi:apoptosis regulatory protein Siva-like [Anneissia japonica]|uniref:apoptosis regulatory protein Siva-like n=1 Tax=Anneissia japonica TaxID=1529436 RepID=UPI001425ACD2|nr:apoptosis regulatory protein Siva-like [Anneissia japonica]